MCSEPIQGYSTEIPSGGATSILLLKDLRGTLLGKCALGHQLLQITNQLLSYKNLLWPGKTIICHDFVTPVTGADIPYVRPAQLHKGRVGRVAHCHLKEAFYCLLHYM